MYQLIIVGAGPAGLTAGLYAQRFKLDFIIISQNIGGTALEAHVVDNYPGFKSISGPDLMKEFASQIDPKKIIQADIKQINKKSGGFAVATYQNKNFQGQAVILAMGKRIRKLGIANESNYIGKGVSYCTACDAPFAQDKIAAVVGGGDSALSAAVKLADIAKKVYLIHRRDEFRGAPAWVEKVKKNKKIVICYSAQVTEVKGNDFLDEIILNTGQAIATNWLFIEIGGRPALDLCQDLNLKTEEDHLVVDKHQATNVAGVFAAGDITNNIFKQIVTACGQGAEAANAVYSYLKK